MDLGDFDLKDRFSVCAAHNSEFMQVLKTLTSIYSEGMMLVEIQGYHVQAQYYTKVNWPIFKPSSEVNGTSLHILILHQSLDQTLCFW